MYVASFAQLDYPLAIAHCNFSLRGVDSDEDENFVKGLATQYGLPFLASVLQQINMHKKKVFLHRWQRVICVMPGFKN